MDLASYKTLVEAMSGHPHVVTMGVRERMVKPATVCAGSNTVSSTATLFTPQRFARLRQSAWGLFFIALLAADNFLVQSKTADAASATARIQVKARVVRSCHISPQTLTEQPGVAANVPVNVKCDKNGPNPVSTREPVRATVSYTWVEGSEDSAGTHLITLDF